MSFAAHVRASVGLAALLMSAQAAYATPFTAVRIGDIDGFGYNPLGLVRATAAPHTTPADTNGNGLLEATEFLPDLNQNGSVATGSGDDFDHRSAAEIANSPTTIGGSGFTDLGSSGAKWTDISLSTSFCTTFPGDPNFPDGPCPGGDAVPNQPVFIYNFHVNGADIVTGSNLFFNVVFGDYDVVPANITLTFASAPQLIIALTTQPGGADGLIQAAFANLAFNNVFTSDGAGGWNGLLRVDFNAPNEPYTAFDYAELSTTPISQTPVPEPTTLTLFGTGVVLLARRRRSRK
jgi:hypothetical protein